MVERKGDVLIGDSWDELDVQVPHGKNGSGSNVKIRTCPECKSTGKKNFNDSSLSIIPIEGKGHCWKCGTKFIVRSEQQQTKKQMSQPEYTAPSKKNITKLTEAGLKLFTDRMISQAAVVRHKIVERMGSVAFPYMFEGECVNIKYRGITEKKFSQSGGGMHVMYNHDNCKEYMDSSADFSVVIVEGEFDSLAFETAGVPFSVSVDSGAPNPTDVVERKLECFTNSFSLFEQAEVVYIAVDNDDNGRRLQQELIRRLPFEKVKTIDWGKYKDANDYLKWEGKEALANIFKSAKDLKMEGVFSVVDAESQLWSMYNNGLAKGSPTHFPSIDLHWKWRFGEVTVMTGYNNEGKSNIIHNAAIVKAAIDEWPFAFYSPENFPMEEFYEDLIHTYTGKTADIEFAGRSTPEEFQAGIDFLKAKFFMVHPSEGRTIERLLDKFDYLVRKQGVRAIIIDPYNQIEHLMKAGETIDLYVSRFMGILKEFAVTRQVAIVLVAHQNPPKTRDANGNYPQPDLYTIKGGGTFADKADNIIYLWRPLRKSNEQDPLVKFASVKIKKKKLVGTVGESDLYYDWKSNRYKDDLLKGKNPLDVILAIMPDERVAQKVAVSDGNLF